MTDLEEDRVTEDLPEEGEERITISLSLTASEWCELANSVESKKLSLENGEYCDDMSEEQIENWADELHGIYQTVSKELASRKISF
jgi:hypothetical protein